MHVIQQISRPCTPSTAAGLWDWFQLIWPRPRRATRRGELLHGMTSWSCMIRAGRHHHHQHTLDYCAFILHCLQKNPDIDLLSSRFISPIHSLNGKSFSDNYSPFSLQSVPMLLRRRDAGCKHWIQIFYWPIRYCEFICAVVVFICYFARYREIQSGDVASVD